MVIRKIAQIEQNKWIEQTTQLKFLLGCIIKNRVKCANKWQSNKRPFVWDRRYDQSNKRPGPEIKTKFKKNDHLKDRTNRNRIFIYRTFDIRTKNVEILLSRTYASRTNSPNHIKAFLYSENYSLVRQTTKIIRKLFHRYLFKFQPWTYLCKWHLM